MDLHDPAALVSVLNEAISSQVEIHTLVLFQGFRGRMLEAGEVGVEEMTTLSSNSCLLLSFLSFCLFHYLNYLISFK